MPGNTLKLSEKVREKSGKFYLPNLWEPCTRKLWMNIHELRSGRATAWVRRTCRSVPGESRHNKSNKWSLDFTGHLKDETLFDGMYR